MSELAEAKARIERLEKALRWFSPRGCWATHPDKDGNCLYVESVEPWEIAQEALKEKT